MKPKHTDIEKHVLKKITPIASERHRLKSVITKLTKDVHEEIQKRNLPITSELVGSTAKDTYLRNNLDIDLFLLFKCVHVSQKNGEADKKTRNSL